MFKRPVLMYRDYCGYVFRGAGNALLDAGESSLKRRLEGWCKVWARS